MTAEIDQFYSTLCGPPADRFGTDRSIVSEFVVQAGPAIRMGFFSPREELSLPFFWSSRLTEIRQQEGNGF